MREIKFRAWDEKSKKMYVDQAISSGSYLNKYLKNPRDCILLQYTGLKDKNDKEIYEGDIIIFRHELDSMIIRDFEDPDVNTRIIGWDKEEACFCFNWINGKQQTSGSTFCKNNLSTIVEIIGNIYENPELLEAK